MELFPRGSLVKNFSANAGAAWDTGSIPDLGRSPGEEMSTHSSIWDFLVAQMVKSLPAMRETWVWSLGWEDPLEKEMATCSSTLAWKIPWTEEPGGLQSTGSQRIGRDWSYFTFMLIIGLPRRHYGKEAPASAGDVRDARSIPRWGRSPGGGMATHSSILAWRIPRTEEPGELKFIGSLRVGHGWGNIQAYADNNHSFFLMSNSVEIRGSFLTNQLAA